jgi:hypothetical protein
MNLRQAGSVEVASVRPFALASTKKKKAREGDICVLLRRIPSAFDPASNRGRFFDGKSLKLWSDYPAH